MANTLGNANNHQVTTVHWDGYVG